MKAEKREEGIEIYLTANEVFSIKKEGLVIGGRFNVIMPDAKIKVLPLSVLETDNSLKDEYSINRLSKAISNPLRCNLFENGDLEVIIPAIVLTDVRIVGAHISRETIKAPLAGNGKKLIEHVIPKDGVFVHFGGSLQVVDLNNYFY